MSAPETATTPVTFKRKASWEGIRLEHYRLPVGELPEHRHREHVVMISLRGSERRDSNCQRHANQRHST